LCVQLSPGTACPPGWTGGTEVTWYQNLSDGRVCPGCTCTPKSAGACPSWRVSQASQATGSCATLLDSLVVTNFCEQNLQSAVTLSALALQLYSPTEPTCAVNPGSGMVSATDPVAICCPSCSCAKPPCNTPACPIAQYCDGSGCQSCTIPTFCGSSCIDCTPRGDSCVSGVCKCGTSAECDAHTSDNCSGGACHCGNGPPCFAANSDSCVAGLCRCGASSACDPATSDSCAGGQCSCGGTPCNDDIANSCKFGACRCGGGAACTGGLHCINNSCQ
jgi:hypothetical protein